MIAGEILQTDGTILLAGLLFLLAWAFFAGGILDRYAHPDEPPTRARFVLAHPGSALGLYPLLDAVGLLLVWLYSLVAPGPGQPGAATILLAFLVGQIYLFARLGLKLWFLAGQTALFQSAERRG